MSRAQTPSKAASTPSVRQEAACAGWWNLRVASNTACAVASGSGAVNAPEATPAVTMTGVW